MSTLTDIPAPGSYRCNLFEEPIETNEMISDATTQTPPRSAVSAETNTESLLGRKVWLPKLVYDALPYFYVTAGFAALFSTLYINHWLWLVPHYVLFSAACVHLGWSVYRKRRSVPGQQAEEPTNLP